MKTNLDPPNVFKIILAVLFLFLISSLFELQIIKGNYYHQIAERNFVRLNRIPATRGEIYDRNYKPVVINIPSLNLYLTPAKIKNVKSLMQFLQFNYGIDPAEVDSLVYNNRFRSYQDILIAENTDYDTMMRVSEDLNYYPSLNFKVETTRQYLIPNHFTGYVGRINADEYSRVKEEGYSINSSIGKTGLEKYYEVLLHGKDGNEIIQVDATGKSLNLFKNNLVQQPENGLSLVLTMDSDLQKYASSVFPGGVNGAIAVIDVKTGGILAYSSKPDFDQNMMMTKINKDDWNRISNDPNKPMLDRVIHGVYPPGSVFKALTASIGLERGVITQYSLDRPCTGGLMIGNRFFRCWSRAGHGSLSVEDALRVSCDVFFYDLSLKLNLDDFQKFVFANHLAQRTGIDLPNERQGLFPNTAWYKKHYGKYTGIIGPKVNLSIGQGEIQVSPLQICAYYAALANNGKWIRPHLLDRAIGNKTILYRDLNQKLVTQLPVSANTLRIIHEGLYKVVNAPGGTGGAARVEGADVYGKTGSAENHVGSPTHAWFVGYYVTDTPQIAVCVFMENAGHGGSSAAPIAGQIMRYYHDHIENNKTKMVAEK
ncbi:MAG TPA: penicillin-binding protein 2 [Candidatus Cloacimonadota bacterium]|nr:penicillin-binding protein 2 [Candidatus Cloacimonadota bacterium]